MSARNGLALPRVVVWSGLAAFTLYAGLRLAAGPARDDTFSAATWTAATIAQVLAITAVLAGAFARAAYVTYRREVAAPPAGALRLFGAKLGVFGEVFTTLVGGLLLLVATYMIVHVPEMLLASQTPQYQHYASASPMLNFLIGGMFGGFGFVLLILRRYVWEAGRGAPLRRWWSRAFGRAHVVTQPIELYWTQFYVKRGYNRVPVAHWLRGQDPKSEGFFRDADLVRVPLDTSPEQLHHLLESWRTFLAQHGISAVGSAVPAPVAAAPAPVAPPLAYAATH